MKFWGITRATCSLVVMLNPAFMFAFMFEPCFYVCYVEPQLPLSFQQTLLLVKIHLDRFFSLSLEPPTPSWICTRLKRFWFDLMCKFRPWGEKPTWLHDYLLTDVFRPFHSGWKYSAWGDFTAYGKSIGQEREKEGVRDGFGARVKSDWEPCKRNRYMM